MATSQQQIAGLTQRNERFTVRVEWLGNRLRHGLHLTMAQRLRTAAQLLRDKVVINISRPVMKHVGVRSGRIVVDPDSRSNRGEFPKADTTRLMHDIFFEVRRDGRSAIVGTTLDYGLILETRMDRSFLRRTLNDFAPTVRMILTAHAEHLE